jgi:hypothetical protein
VLRDDSLGLFGGLRVGLLKIKFTRFFLRSTEVLMEDIVKVGILTSMVDIRNVC